MPERNITRFTITFMGSRNSAATNLGWIQLLNGTTPSGYIYIHNIPDTTPLPNDYWSTSGYVVMNIRQKMLESVLSILKGPKPLVISVGNQTSGAQALLTSNIITSFSDDLNDVNGTSSDEDEMRIRIEQERQMLATE